jgi:DNA-binding MarR family transcriptional regulator
MPPRSDEQAPHELDAPPWRRVESTLMATARALRQAFDRRFEALGLNLSQASVLAFLQEAGPQSQTSLARMLGIGRAAAGNVIDGLETRGLVERQPDPSDRRVWLVAPTAAGKDLAGPIHELDTVLRTELRAGISRAERQQLAQLLLRLQANLAGALARQN